MFKEKNGWSNTQGYQLCLWPYGNWTKIVDDDQKEFETKLVMFVDNFFL